MARALARGPRRNPTRRHLDSRVVCRRGARRGGVDRPPRGPHPPDGRDRHGARRCTRHGRSRRWRDRGARAMAASLVGGPVVGGCDAAARRVDRIGDALGRGRILSPGRRARRPRRRAPTSMEAWSRALGLARARRSHPRTWPGGSARAWCARRRRPEGRCAGGFGALALVAPLRGRVVDARSRRGGSAVPCARRWHAARAAGPGAERGDRGARPGVRADRHVAQCMDRRCDRGRRVRVGHAWRAGRRRGRRQVGLGRWGVERGRAQPVRRRTGPCSRLRRAGPGVERRGTTAGARSSHRDAGPIRGRFEPLGCCGGAVATLADARSAGGSPLNHDAGAGAASLGVAVGSVVVRRMDRAESDSAGVRETVARALRRGHFAGRPGTREDIDRTGCGGAPGFAWASGRRTGPRRGTSGSAPWARGGA